MPRIDYQDLEFRHLSDRTNLTSFRCSDHDLEEFLKDDALDSQNNRLSATRLVYCQDALVGYFTLVNDSLVVDAVSPGDGERDYPYRKYPAVKVARLATHRDYERRRIGSNMLIKIFNILIKISQHTGCRIITVDATGNAVGFYSKMGFKIAIQKPGETIPLYIDFHRFVSEEESRQTTTLST